MKDDQVRRYARHILLHEVGGLGQTALLQATARLELRESTPDAELIAARYLAAGGVGTLVIAGGNETQAEAITSAGPDSKVRIEPATSSPAESSAVRALQANTVVALAATPSWWPRTPGDDLALAYWRGAIAATRWMSNVATR